MNRGDRNRDHHPRHPDRQQGEGDGQPAQRCNEKQHTFVRTARGHEVMHQPGVVEAFGERTRAQAEATGLARASSDGATM
jgi:hypothetical protein